MQSNLIRENCCDGCGRQFADKERLVALFYVDVDGRHHKGNQIRLKLSEGALSQRSIAIYCDDCLKLEKFMLKEEKGV